MENGSRFAAVVAAEPSNGLIHLHGELDGATAPILTEAAEQVMQAGSRHLTMDCTRLEFCDSRGLRALVAICHQLGDDGSVTLSEPSEWIRKVLSMTMLDTLLRVVPEAPTPASPTPDVAPSEV